MPGWLDKLELELDYILGLAMPPRSKKPPESKVIEAKMGLGQKARIEDKVSTLRMIVLYQLFDREAAEREFWKRRRFFGGDNNA